MCDSHTDKKFDPAKRAKLNNPERLAWVQPERILSMMPKGSLETLVDIGAGTGFITAELARLTPSAQIYALDIEPIMVEEMRQTLANCPEILPRLMERNRLPFADDSVDAVTMIALFHELPEPETLLAEVRRALRPGGAVIVVDWERNASDLRQGPPVVYRFTAGEVIRHLENVGFVDCREEGGFLDHFGVVGTKPVP